MTHWKTTFDPDDGDPTGELCYCDIDGDHDGKGDLMFPEREAIREREAQNNKPLLDLAGEIPPELKTKLLAIHDGLYCAARNEGLNCCLDFLIGTWGP